MNNLFFISFISFSVITKFIFVYYALVIKTYFINFKELIGSHLIFIFNLNGFRLIINKVIIHLISEDYCIHNLWIITFNFYLIKENLFMMYIFSSFTHYFILFYLIKKYYFIWNLYLDIINSIFYLSCFCKLI